MKYKIYTDGACSGNPGEGGYAYVVIYEKRILPLLSYGSMANTTNNHMELMAIVKGLHQVTKSNPNAQLEVTVYSDSAYCINSATLGWVNFWEKNGWRTKGGEPVKNKELWEQYLSIVKDNPKMKLTFEKVKGHSGDKFNEMVDKAAKDAIRTA